MQYIETTVANQGVIRALFKGLLLYHMHDVTLCFDYMQVRWWCQIKQGKNQKYGANAPHLHHISPQAAPGASPPAPSPSLMERGPGGEARTLGFSQPSGASITI